MALSRLSGWSLAAGLLLGALSAHAGGPRWYTGAPFYTAPEGQPVVFFTMNAMYYTDPGDLNAHVSHAQADAMVMAAASTWNVPTSALTLAQGGVLGEHVSSTNAYFDGNGVVFPDDVKAANYRSKPIAIVYDTDGSVIDTLLGSGASGPSGCRQNAVVESVDGLDPAGTIDHAVLVLNGRCVGANADQLTQMRYQLVRAFGRVIGVGWSQLNDNVFTGVPTPTALQVQNWPVMHPIDVLCGPYTYKCMAQAFRLRPDDLSVLALLYPVTSANIVPGKTLSGDGAMIQFGFVNFPTGQGMDALNIVVTRRIDFGSIDTYEIASAVTGAGHRQFFGNPITGGATGPRESSGLANDYYEGLYVIQRVPLVGFYEAIFATTESINPLYSGDYAVGAYIGPPNAMSGSAITIYDGLEIPGRVAYLPGIMADAPSSCNTGNDGVESAPVDADASGWWNNLLCSNGHAAWAAQTVRAGRSWTLEATAVDESGAGTTRKTRLLLGLWKAGDPTGTLPTVARTVSALNATIVGMTQMHVDAVSTAQSYRIAIADERGMGRPDFAYKARLLYADSLLPMQVGASGGRITIAGQGFRSGNVVTVNGVRAAVESWSATQIVAIAPTRLAAGMDASGAADVAVVDASTGGSTVMQAALSYAGTAVDSISLVSAPTQVSTLVLSGTAFSVRVLFSDGTSAASASVRFVASGAAATFAVCGAAACTLTTDANGIAQSYFTASATGTITLTATEQSGGADVQAVVNAVAPVITMQLVSAPGSVETGIVSGTAFAVRVLRDGSPLVGADVRFAATEGVNFAACGAATCIVTTNASGVVQSLVMALAAGSITLSATEQSSGASVQAVMVDRDPVRIVVGMNTPRYIAAGAVASWTVSVAATQDGQAVVGQSVGWTATSPLTLSVASSVTDAGGIATVGVATAGLGSVQQAVVQGCAWMGVCSSASAFGVDPSQWTIAVASGAGQSVQANVALAPVVMLVRDLAGHPVEAASVTVYQRVDAWEGVCPSRGRCAAAPVLASSRKTLTTDSTGNITITPLEVPGVASVVNIAAVTGTQGFVSMSLPKLP